MIHLAQWLEAQSSGSTTEDEVRFLSAHVAHCAACRNLLTRDADIRDKLGLLRLDEPRVDVLERVMRQIDDEA